MTFKEWFKASGLTQSAVAIELGVTPATVSNLCSGRQDWVSRDLAANMLRVTKGEVTPTDFLEEWQE